MILLSLPFPVSVNAMYSNKGRSRTKSQRYRTWANAAGWDVKAQKQEPIKGPYSLTITLFEKDRKRRDPDNFCKCINDLLVAHELVEDDSQCVTLIVYRELREKAGAQVIVRPSNGIVDRRAA